MLALLAAQPDGFFDTMTAIFRRPDTLAHPQTLLHHLQHLSIVWGAIFLAAGIACLLQGYRYYKAVTIAMALVMGALVGYGLGQRINDHYIVAACLSALLGVCCWRLMKYGVAIMGGLAGAFLGANGWSAIIAGMNARGGHASLDPALQSHWIGALIGLLVCGMLAFILFKLSVVLFTCVSGATIAVFGAISLLMQVPSWQDNILRALADNAVVLPLLVIVPAIIGLILQQAQPIAAGEGKATPKPA